MRIKDKYVQDNIINVENYLKELSRLNDQDVLKKMNTSYKGLNDEQVEISANKFGKNIIDIKNKPSSLKRVKEAIINPFNVVLIIVAIVTFFTDVVISKEQNYATLILIILTVLISSIISFSQQEKSDKAAKKLQSMISNKVDVIRNATTISIDIEDVVPGDIVKLSSGDMIPGDVRFLKVKDLFIDQASLTGESLPIEKFIMCKENRELTELDNIGFMGTNIVSGSAIAVIISTGTNTYFGSMAKSLSTVKSKNTFERDIDSVSNLLIKFMIIMVPIIFVVNLFTKEVWWEALLFGITIAVGLTPEMFPVIMTSTLAKGAMVMSKNKTIVKRLSSIQTLGEMDILCTDKTGTLTEDEIILEKYMNVEGKEDNRILRHAFLNSYFQTGLKNLIDVAIISRAEKDGIDILKEQYSIEDEIPFDFARRRMSVVIKDKNGKRQLITKGAVDEIISICSYIEKDGIAINMNEEMKKKAIETYEKYNNEGLRIVAVAQKNEIHDIENFGIKDEKDMVLIGFVGFLDPPKKSAKTALQALNNNGVNVIVLTGDSEGVAVNVCNKLNIDVTNKMTGKEIETKTDEELKAICENCHLYSKLSPLQKQRIIKIYQQNGHTVGYMGDGINDSSALRQSDVGISVDSAVDIAKETADIILLEKDLNVLENGVIEGRKTFANISKYINMATSGNFGNMLSVIIASIFLPFLPLLPIHILIQNLLCDIAQIGMPFDNVDSEYLKKPKKLNITSVKRIIFNLGIISTVLDIICFIILWYIMKFNTIEKQSLFQSGWFVFGIISQTLIIHMIRTAKVPFVKSVASKQLIFSTISVVIITLIIGFTNISVIFDLGKLSLKYFIYLIILLIVYALLIQIVKKRYIKKYNEWL